MHPTKHKKKEEKGRDLRKGVETEAGQTNK